MPADGQDPRGGGTPPNQPYRPPHSWPPRGHRGHRGPFYRDEHPEIPEELSQVVDGVSRGARRAWEFGLKPLLASAVGGLAGIIVGGLIGEAVAGDAGGGIIALFWFAGALGSFLYMRKRAHDALTPSEQPMIQVADTRAVRQQVACIRTKSRNLQQAARQAGAPFGDLERLAEEMLDQAERLAAQVFKLRKAADDVRRDAGKNPRLLTTIRQDVEAPELQGEYRAAQEAQSRVDQMLAANEAQQALCLARIERIEALLDTARLELLRPVDSPTDTTTYGSRGIVEEVETELDLTREALREAERTEEQW